MTFGDFIGVPLEATPGECSDALMANRRAMAGRLDLAVLEVAQHAHMGATRHLSPARPITTTEEP